MPDADGARTEIEEVQAWAAGLEAMHARIAGRFARAEPRRRVLAYLRGLLGAVTRKNGRRPMGGIGVRPALATLTACWFWPDGWSELGRLKLKCGIGVPLEQATLKP